MVWGADVLSKLGVLDQYADAFRGELADDGCLACADSTLDRDETRADGTRFEGIENPCEGSEPWCTR